MNNKIAYLIFGLSLIIFILVYVFVPTVELIERDYDWQVEDEDSGYEQISIVGQKYVKEKYEGSIRLDRVWTRINLIFTSINEDILVNNSNLEEYYKKNETYVKEIYDVNTKEEFMALFDTFKELGTDIVSTAILEETIKELEDGIKFNLIAYAQAKDENANYKIYECMIYNVESQHNVIFKIIPFKEVE